MKLPLERWHNTIACLQDSLENTENCVPIGNQFSFRSVPLHSELRQCSSDALYRNAFSEAPILFSVIQDERMLLCCSNTEYLPPTTNCFDSEQWVLYLEVELEILPILKHIPEVVYHQDRV
ncbi:hypothetical protein TNCV_1569911 [Trichonephila clavipes]|uniref:Uncharacterized protein n=1 Tax=Trichonephila clavipes TaxID=2585209 RepID=A0A8X6SPF6_TRICX|nr:hypothetical protein TNCV_1569911 [Trichonephila clavipes]